MLKSFKPRLYQETILATCVTSNTLVVLPTGLGKTAVAFLLAEHRLKQYPNSKIVVLAPTKPLVEQHKISFMKYLDYDDSDYQLFTGAISPDKRKKLWVETKFIFSTPQTLENDLLTGRISLSDVSLIVFDEAHRGVGEYAYTFVAKQYHKQAKYSKILALTASPGSDKEKINEILGNLFIEAIEVRSEDDPDVKPYVQKVDVEWHEVKLSKSFEQIKDYLEACYKSKLVAVKEEGFIKSIGNIGSISKKEILGLMSSLQGEISSGNRDIPILKSISLVAEAMKVQHGIELLETQGIGALWSYMGKMNSEARTGRVKASKNLVMDLNYRSAMILTKNLYDAGVEHPKLGVLKTVLVNELGLKNENPKLFDKSESQTSLSKKVPSVNDLSSKNKKVIIFTQYRDSGSRIVEIMNSLNGVSAKLFVGQSKKGGTGLSQKKQIEMLEQFRNNEFNTIVMTSVGEEGLDIPQVNSVIFYEPIPSAIRTVQRRGRTGRLDEGKVIILYAKKTRDEVYMWVAKRKEQKMYKLMDEIKKGFSNLSFKNKDISKMSDSINRGQKSLKSYSKKDLSEIKIIADSREKGSQVLKELVSNDVKLELCKLDVADYLLSGRVAVEFKKVPDFVDSIIDGRLLQQIKMLKNTYERPLIIVEGIQDIFSVRQIHPNAIYGMMSTIAISYGVPIIQTRNHKETANMLAMIASKEQVAHTKPFQLHLSKPVSLKEQQEYVVSSFPGIGTTLSKPLLKKFGSIKKIVNATESDLMSVDKIGAKKAKNVKNLMDYEYLD